MGCDIHLHTEVKINGTWHHYATLHPQRNYTFFTKLCGVRGPRDGITPFCEPRGLPLDASFLTKFTSDQDGPDGHSHSYITSKEIVELEEFAQAQGWKGEHGIGWWMADQFGYFFGNDWSSFELYPDSRLEGVEDVRFVFWFDN